MSTFLWFLLGALYLAALIVLGVTTLRKGHYFLFAIGIVFPILWIVGALIGPTPRAAAGAA
ncbi:MAG: 7 transmembrane receptor [Gaiellaceae bacterium]